MNANRAIRLSVIALSLLSGAAYADSGKTLAQSQEEYIAARENGDIPAGFAAKTQREVFGGNAAGDVPAQAPVARALVDEGEVPLGFSGHTARELFPGNYPVAASTLTREEVRAEYLAARKAGELPIGFAAVPAKLIYPVGQEATVNVASHRATNLSLVPAR